MRSALQEVLEEVEKKCETSCNMRHVETVINNYHSYLQLAQLVAQHT